MEIPVIGHLISQLMNQAKLTNADARLTRKFVWSIIDKHARWLIKRESSKLRIMKLDYLFQRMRCVPVIEMSTIDEDCGIKTKCKIWRTRDKIPDLYTDEDGIIIKAVYSVDGSEEYTPIKLQELMRKLENPHSRYDKSRYYYFYNGYLYFPNQPIHMVEIKGYFQDEIVNECRPDEHHKRCWSHMQKKLRVPEYVLGELMDHALNDLINTKKIPTDPKINKEENR